MADKLLAQQKCEYLKTRIEKTDRMINQIKVSKSYLLKLSHFANLDAGCVEAQITIETSEEKAMIISLLTKAKDGYTKEMKQLMK